MFDFDTTKLLLIGVVALAVIPPKDLPRVIRQVGQAVGKVRRMASEFQGQVMEALKEAELDDLKKELSSITDSAKAEMTAITDAAKVNVDFNPMAEAQHEMSKAIAGEPGKLESLTGNATSTPGDVYAQLTGQVGQVTGQAGQVTGQAGYLPEHPPLPGEASLDTLAAPDMPAPPLVTHDLIAAQAGIAVENAATAAGADAKAQVPIATRTVDLRHPEALAELSSASSSLALPAAEPAETAPPMILAATDVAEIGVEPDAAPEDIPREAAPGGPPPAERIPYRKRVAYAAPQPGRAARAARRES